MSPTPALTADLQPLEAAQTRWTPHRCAPEPSPWRTRLCDRISEGGKAQSRSLCTGTETEVRMCPQTTTRRHADAQATRPPHRPPHARALAQAPAHWHRHSCSAEGPAVPPPGPSSLPWGSSTASGHRDPRELKRVGKRGRGSSKHSTHRDPAAAHGCPLPQKPPIESSQLARAWARPAAPSLPHGGYTRPASPEGRSRAPSSRPVSSGPGWRKTGASGRSPPARGPHVPARLPASASSPMPPGPRRHPCRNPAAATGSVAPVVAVDTFTLGSVT